MKSLIVGHLSEISDSAAEPNPGGAKAETSAEELPVTAESAESTPAPDASTHANDQGAAEAIVSETSASPMKLFKAMFRPKGGNTNLNSGNQDKKKKPPSVASNKDKDKDEKKKPDSKDKKGKDPKTQLA
ncbi:hypothetical protein HWV62_21800 [Athelia sp. TMB]|nr:hypothetical protein HWV62_21800 [Athelia sp. TMB]